MPAVPSNAIATGQVAMTAAAVQIVPPRADRKRVTLVMGGATPAVTAIGNSSGVTANNGVQIAGVAGQTLVLETTSVIFGIGAATATISYIEEFA